ncbi:immunoglobulin domain-containing protein [Solibacillus sp. A46]|uniref:Immunoglobulin domain-containing protein n=2 Tax=Solibacillus TaxID=648800 RepID=A0ABR8Y2Z4_9BACL|nr:MULTISPECIES: immunoglobulin domain-containing protein [Solibacillus]MBD8033039.1 immunoglobulin domain-containing protein [Solibacillus merdavium]MBD8038516.1 immunoglobulin domain-containing protein [Solibacillus faecavium]
MNDKALKKITLLLVVLFLTFGTMIPNKNWVQAASGTPPKVININRNLPLDEKTNATSITYLVTFSESVTGVDSDDFILTTTGNASGRIASVVGGGTIFQVMVNDITGVGTLRLDLKPSGTGIVNGDGLAIATGYTVGQVYTVGTAPTIITQPSNQTITAGGSATFTVTATGDATLSYQWQKGGINIVGATSASLTINNLQTSDAGDYTVVVTNEIGNVTSNAATLSIKPATVAPTITTQPSDKTITVGGGAIFTVTATGDAPLNYQWKKGGVDIAGGASASLTINNVQISDAGSYTVVVTNAVGNVTSNTATLTVTPVPVALEITTQPSNQMIIAGGSATFTVTATSDTSLSYQWKKDGADIVGATRASLTINNVQAGDAGIYAVVVTNAVGNATSNAATLTVMPAPTPVDPTPGNGDVEVEPTQPAPVNPTPTVPTQPTPSVPAPTDTVTPPADNTETTPPLEVPTETPSVEQDILKLVKLDLPVGLVEGSVTITINKETGNLVITSTELNNTRAATITIPVLTENANKILKIRTANGLEAVAYTIKDGKIVVQLHKAGELVFVDANIDLTDISNNQFRSDIEMLAQRGIFTGDNGKFNPTANMTRAQFAGTLVRALGLNETATSFADVNSSTWYAGSAGALADLGLMNGESGAFNPGGKITRQQMFAVLSNLLEAKGIEASNDLTGDFKDASKVSDYAKPHVSILIEIGAVSGDNGLLKPQENVTKGQMAKVLAKVLAKVEAL